MTNREFKEFIDAGGYREPSHWQDLPFGETVRSGRQRSRVSSMRPAGPGRRPGNRAHFPTAGDHPVAGVSWFEAMAYARFRGKELPTAFHWYRAAYSLNEFMDSISSAVVDVSNYAGKATAPVGQYQGIGPYGTLDMAGNVREWLWTAIGTPG